MKLLSTVKIFLKALGIYSFITNCYDAWIENRALRKFIRHLSKKNFDTNLFFFFPSYATGGAEKVHLQILEIVSSRKPVIFITSSPPNQHYLSHFSRCGTVIELFPYLRNSQNRLFGKLTATIAGKINKAEGAKTFGCDSMFYYQLLPFLSHSVTCIDLFHTLVHEHEIGPEKWSLPVVSRIDYRVCISLKAKNDLAGFYKKNGVDEALLDRVKIINNKIHIPDSFEQKNYSDPLKVLFVGRPDKVKRIYLIGQIARKVSEVIPIEFVLVGRDLINQVEPVDVDLLSFEGEVKDPNRMEQLYKEAHILLITSSREGMPMVVMESMVYGVVPICTSVGAIPDHITSQENGILIDKDQSDKNLVEDFCKEIVYLNNNRSQLRKLSANAYEYAKDSFNGNTFDAEYQSLLHV
jgi:glycosyltransferase involved in cell wall biosynthesis